MVYHRLDSSTSSSAAPQQLSETTSDIKEDIGKSPIGPEGEGLMDEHNSWDGSEDKGSDGQKAKDGQIVERSRSRNGRDDRFSRSRARSRERHDRSRSRDRRENFKDRERIDDCKYDDSKHSERSRYRESSRYRDRSRSYERYSDDPRADEQRYSEGRYRGESSRFDDESRYSDNSRRYSRHKGDRGDDWYSDSRSRYREGRRSGSSRYSDDDSRYGDGSRKWKDRDARSSDRESKTVSTSRPEKLQNMFQNDGSFLEMFKKMQEANKPPEVKEAEETLASDGLEGLSSASVQDSSRGGVSALKRPAISIVGKRRGGRVLPTGMVRKVKRTEEEEEQPPKDAWSLYMAEVKKYKESSCEEEGKMRPLVK